VLVFSALYWLFALVTMPPLLLGALVVFLVTVPFDRRRLAIHLYSCFWGGLYVRANPFWRLRVVGRQRIPWRGPAVLVANHLSLVDILALYLLFRPFKWVSKAELFRIPIVGWNMRLNDYVPLVRGDRESIRQMMDHCRRHLDRGSPVLIFPEGTRSRDGRLQPFKDGAFRLAVEAGVPLIPIAVSGTSEALPKHGVKLGPMRDGEVRVLAPLDPRAFEGPDALKEAARAALLAELPERHRPLPRADRA
jgi:1-acyl-sn-glycerol-3-phosphate acyltransferase